MRFRLQYGRESHEVEVPDEDLPTASPAILRDQAAKFYPQAHLPSLKLIAQGKTLANDMVLADLVAPNRAVVTVLLVAAKVDEVAAFAEVESKRKLIEARVRDDRELEPVTRLSTAKFVHEAFSKHQRQMALARSDERFGFGEVRALPGFADADAVVERLQRIALHAGVLAVMKAHKWFVPVLSEMYPDGKVGVDPVCVLGLNVNKGQEIKLRLRTDDLAGFRKADVVWKTVWHELAHNEISEHTGAFYDFVSSLTREGAAGDWRSRGGHRTDGDAAGGNEWGSDDRFVQLAAHTASSRGGPAFVGGSGTAGGALGGGGPGVLLGIDSAVDPDVAAAVRAEAARRRLGAGVPAAGFGRAEGSVVPDRRPRSPSPASAAALSAPMSQGIAEDDAVALSSHMVGCTCGAHSAAQGASASIAVDPAAPHAGPPVSLTSTASAASEPTESSAMGASDESDSVAGSTAHPGSSTGSSATAAAVTHVSDEQKALWRRAMEEALSEAVAECLVAGVAVREALTTVLGILTRAADALQSLAQTGGGLRAPTAATPLLATEASKYLRLKPHNAAFKARTGGGLAVLHLLQDAGFVPDDVTGSGPRDGSDAGLHIHAATADGEGMERLVVAREVVMGALSTL